MKDIELADMSFDMKDIGPVDMILRNLKNFKWTEF